MGLPHSTVLLMILPLIMKIKITTIMQCIRALYRHICARFQLNETCGCVAKSDFRLKIDGFVI